MKLTTQDVIKEFKKVHGNKYDYSKVKYLNMKSPVSVICNIHGKFLQSPDNHKRGKGCPECAGTRKLTKEKVIKEFKKIHGNKYDYSKVVYENTGSKVIIICPEHGQFTQRVAHHKNGIGCPCCGGSNLRTSNEVIKEFKEIHGDKYDYSKVDYQNTVSKIIIICRIHGEFLQMPSSHKQGAGCPKCLGRNLSSEAIIQEFKKVHGDKYDYSKVIYKNINSKVLIICKEHGAFQQNPSHHKNGTGCPKCSGKVYQ